MAAPLRALMLLAITALLASACGADARDLPAVRVALADFRFEPAVIEVAAGQRIELRVTNTGMVEHDLTSDALGLHLHATPGQRSATQVGPFAPGEYEISCTVTGHRALGMVGRIRVR